MNIPPLTRAQVRELKRRIKQIEDPRRWVVHSPLPGMTEGRGFYYLADIHGYTMVAKEATLFKKRAIAVAVGAALDALRKNKKRAPHRIKLVRV